MGNEKKKRAPRNKQTKQTLVFDDNARLEFLTGFRKRKNERRKKAKDEKEIQLKEDRKEFKRKRKEMIEKSFFFKGRSKQKGPELDDIGKPTVTELPEHTVTITDISVVDMVGHSGLRLGQNQFEEDQTSGTLPPVEFDPKQHEALQRNIKKLKRKEVAMLNKEMPKKRSKRPSQIGHIKDKKSQKKFQMKKTKEKNKKKGRK
ncbi:nucleolar protein 12-like [Mizuhopecten yessoensis]|uniref:Nucleolar protein 12 n=1 Tax=Mizuhopecten yessoensis TaxID=6573 RepID=A0A210QCL8_MIZYE|nr:nucleolar protein 12-like [Mizuhopecten yessoensis]OWF46464.1 Nucleolar protein 12 [Mizuhopecten yessoensis]